MMRHMTILISCLLPFSLTVNAAERVNQQDEVTTLRLHPTSLNMPADEYRRSTRRNQQAVKQAMANWARENLHDLEELEPTLGVLGVTVDLAVNDPRYKLNDSGTLGIRFRDTIRSKRSLMLEYHTRW